MTYTPSPSEQKTRLNRVTWRRRDCPKHCSKRELTSMTTVAIVFCNISFNTIRTVRNAEFEGSHSTGYVGIDESLMIFCDKVRSHPRLTTIIVPKYGAVRVSGSKHFKRIISNSSQLIHMRTTGGLQQCTCPTILHELTVKRRKLQGITCLSRNSNSTPK